MFIDARTLPTDSVVETDICVIGAGAAGITISKEFLNSQLQVCVLESGGFEADGDTQELYIGDNIGIPYFPLIITRLRYFGGTTNHWGGLCRPFGEEDFQEHEWVPYSGWPISLNDLLPYYKRAGEILGLNTLGWELENWNQHDYRSPLRFSGNKIQTRLVQKAKPQLIRLGESYRNEIEKAENIQVYLNANVTDIESDEVGKKVSQLKVECLSGNKFLVKARVYVLATGGIENPRLLLLSNKSIPAGLGNQNDLVGRFFMEHPRFAAGEYSPSDLGLEGTEYYSWHGVKQTAIKGYLHFPKEVLRQEEMVDVQIRFDLLRVKFFEDADKSPGVESYREVSNSISEFETPDELAKHIGNIISDIDDIAITAYRKLRYGDLPLEKIVLYPRINQTPNPDSRVTLSNDLDKLNQRKVQLNWQLSSIDMHSVKRAMELTGTELGKAGLGRLRDKTVEMQSWPADVHGGWHHTGTTRMSHDAKHGVVDKNCQVFGTSNLYIAGSSVFPTAGSGTPTLTIMALAIKLADFIKKEIS